MAWNPEQYLKFEQPRLRPALDLLTRVTLEAPRTVYDLGCGAGNVTRLLAARWPNAAITGVDDSSAMLEEAARELSRIVWQNVSIAKWSPEAPPDLIYSNAALHWLPNHAELFPRLTRMLAPNGVLAVQMPRNFGARAYTLVDDTVRSGPWRARLEHLLRPAPVQEPHFYYRLLARDASSLDIWESEYLQVLHGSDPVKEWLKGSWLKQFLDALEPPERGAFEDEYARRVLDAYPPEKDGATLFPFRRLFIVATKG